MELYEEFWDPLVNRLFEIVSAKGLFDMKLERNHCREAFIKLTEFQMNSAIELLKQQMERDSWMNTKFKKDDRVKIYGHSINGETPLTTEGYIASAYSTQGTPYSTGPWWVVDTTRAQDPLVFHERQLELAPEPKVLYVRQDATFAHGFYILTEEEFAKSERKGEYTKFVEAASGQ